MAQDKVEVMTQGTAREVECYIKPPRPPKWLVMIYLAGDNNLSANCIDILQEIEAAFDSYPRYADDVRVLACFDPNTPRVRGARYFEIGFRRKYSSPNSNLRWELHNDLVPLECLPGNPVEAPDFCCDDPADTPIQQEPVPREGLSRFIRFALRHHRDADKRMLILFGHGSAVAGNTFLADSTPPSFLRLKEFRQVLARHFDAREQPLSQADEAENDDVPDAELTAEEKEEKQRRKPLDILACDNCMMNGIESAYEIRRRVKYMLGSQGLVLALGWPFRKVIEEVLRHRNKGPKFVADRILRVCARNLLDYALMDRSSEQSLCDLTTFRHKPNLVTAVKRLSRAMQDGLAHDDCGKLKYPAICDAIRLARLEAQSYWSETFVDLYDFCALLLERSSATLFQLQELFAQLQRTAAAPPTKYPCEEGDKFEDLLGIEIMQRFGEIGDACWGVLVEIKANQEKRQEKRPRFVLQSYYIGSDLQYSNGVSIYFPWTLPEDPIIFEQEEYGIRGGARNGLSWAELKRAQAGIKERARAEFNNPSLAEKQLTDFKLITAFDEYREYDFAKRYGGDWAACLTAFFKATLRDVRRFDFRYEEIRPDMKFFERHIIPDPDPERLLSPSPVNLQKSSSDVDSETDCTCPTIKNYPRRFYLSPADCLRKCPEAGCDPTPVPERCYMGGTDKELDKEVCVSYLGWYVRGLVAEEINPKKDGPEVDGKYEAEPDMKKPAPDDSSEGDSRQ